MNINFTIPQQKNRKKHITSRDILLGYMNSYSISNIIGIFIYWDIIGTFMKNVQTNGTP